MLTCLHSRHKHLSRSLRLIALIDPSEKRKKSAGLCYRLIATATHRYSVALKLLASCYNRASHMSATRWQDATIPSFLIQQAVSTVAAMVLGHVVAIVPAILIAAATKNTSAGNWADHLVDQHI